MIGGEENSAGIGKTSAEFTDAKPSENLIAKRIGVKTAIERGRVLNIFGNVDPGDGDNNFQRWLPKLEELGTSQPVVIRISTHGGDAEQVEQLNDKVDQMRSEGLVCYTLGKSYCISSGIPLLLVGHPDGVFVEPNTRLQFHGTLEYDKNASWATPERIAWMRQKRLERQRETIYRRLAQQSGMDMGAIETDWLNDIPLTSEEALMYGLVDGIYYDRPNITAEDAQRRDDRLKLYLPEKDSYFAATHEDSDDSLDAAFRQPPQLETQVTNNEITLPPGYPVYAYGKYTRLLKPVVITDVSSFSQNAHGQLPDNSSVSFTILSPKSS